MNPGECQTLSSSHGSIVVIVRTFSWLMPVASAIWRKLSPASRASNIAKPSHASAREASQRRSSRISMWPAVVRSTFSYLGDFFVLAMSISLTESYDGVKMFDSKSTSDLPDDPNRSSAHEHVWRLMGGPTFWAECGQCGEKLNRGNGVVCGGRAKVLAAISS